ncbi:MAG: 23S rRNA (adenine(2503)-C(2))-methyltransferase RlmN [Thermaerobacter sp.]|nr:23S rRNA (adenine(2503)-C(2))-methyltransferase RlmN [Thermaerobacter sp.]
MPSANDVLSLDADQLVHVLQGFGEPAFRARQLFEWLWRHDASSYQDVTVWSRPLRERMSQAWPIRRAVAVQTQVGVDGTTKLLLGLSDGQRVETVLLPHPYGYSVCVSSQVGCAMGCTFCASGLNGRIRQLSAGELLEQVRYAEMILKPSGQHVRRVDVMGIGEPLDNYANLLKFMRMAHHEAAFHLSYRHFTVSTSGLVPAITQLANEGLPVTLAVSLHAPNDEVRRRLMPVNQAYPLAKLIPACDDFARRTGRRVTFEYLLLKDVNDSQQLAHELAGLLAGRLCHVNLIPWNPVAEHDWTPSPMSTVRTFQRIVQDQGISCTIRKELGQEIDAACGQLRLREEESLSL